MTISWFSILYLTWLQPLQFWEIHFKMRFNICLDLLSCLSPRSKSSLRVASASSSLSTWLVLRSTLMLRKPFLLLKPFWLVLPTTTPKRNLFSAFCGIWLLFYFIIRLFFFYFILFLLSLIYLHKEHGIDAGSVKQKHEDIQGLKRVVDWQTKALHLHSCDKPTEQKY